MILVLLLACAPEVTTRTLEDEGSVCLDDEGQVQVTFPDCLSSSCDTLVSAECTAELVDGVLEVHAKAVIESQGEVCTTDCGLVQATCEMPLVEDPGTVQFSYGGELTDLDAACEGV
ncbi:MAG: hypothetical protein FJ090_01580 [Deltaproteobacteria bacterium]|nr:hypothetical protein [Deltaproteobacteria bacterium]MBM4389786.1 hypothetical protein [Deltaproteobacteria bacterium]